MPLLPLMEDKDFITAENSQQYRHLLALKSLVAKSVCLDHCLTRLDLVVCVPSGSNNSCRKRCSV